MKNLFKLTFLIPILLIIMSCGKDGPYFPRTYYKNIEDVVIKEFDINSIKTTNQPIFSKNSRIAVFEFQSPEDSKGGVLVSDIFSLTLQKQGFNVIERDNINRVLTEQKYMKSGITSLSDIEVAKKLGRLISADYMVFGAVTLYKSEGQTVYIPVNIVEEDRDGYTEEYNVYRDWYINKWFPIWDTEQVRVKKLRSESGVLSLSELDEELKKISKMEFKVIASIGVSAKIVDVRTAKILWMGQGETTDFTLVDGTNRILEKFIQSIQDKK